MQSLGEKLNAYTEIVPTGKLASNSFFRLAVSAAKGEIEKNIRRALSEGKELLTDGYHIHCSNSNTLIGIKKNQLWVYVSHDKTTPTLKAQYLDAQNTPRTITLFPKKADTLVQTARIGARVIESGANMLVATLSSTPVNESVVDKYSSDDALLNNIIKKVQSNTPLNSQEISKIFERAYGTNPLEKLPQNNNPLLKTMDDYIFSMQKKQSSGHINFAMAEDKIKFTETLRTFVENPTDDNWHAVRKAMHQYPRYGFSWTGTSQADFFLTVIKIQHEDKIDGHNGFDATYAKNKWQAKTSWGRFVYNFGFLYYIPSFFLALAKVVQFIYHEMCRASYQHQIDKLKSNLRPNSQNDGIVQRMNPAVSNILEKLETYLSEDDTLVTEDVVTYIDEIESHLNKVKDANLRQQIRTLCANITTLIPRPIPTMGLPSND